METLEPKRSQLSCPSPDCPSNQLSRSRPGLFLTVRNQTVPSIFKHTFVGGAIVAFVLGLWLAQLWSAENQVRLHTNIFCGRLKSRRLRARRFLAPDCTTIGATTARSLSIGLRMVFRVFSSLRLTAGTPQVVILDSPAATWSASIRLEGAGGEFAPEIIGRINGLTTPFELHWQRESWRPCDWKLVQVSNPALELSGQNGLSPSHLPSVWRNSFFADFTSFGL